MANVEALRGMYAEWAKGNLAAGTELLADDVLFEPVPERMSMRGVERMGAYMREFLEQWNDFTLTAEDYLEVGDSVIVTERQRGTGVASGASLDNVYYAVWTFRDGKVVRARWELSRADALASAGARD